MKVAAANTSNLESALSLGAFAKHNAESFLARKSREGNP